MQITIHKQDGSEYWCDRNGVLNEWGREALEISVDGVILHFVDELDAVAFAKAILERMGETFNGDLP